MKLANRTNPHLNGKPPLPNGTHGTGAVPKNADGRDLKSGQFTAGNTAAVGHVNPTARARAELQRALVAAVRAEDISALAKTLLENAKGGDVPSAELLLKYVLGRPAPAADPDRLEVDAWQLVQNWPSLAELVVLLTRAIKPALASQLVGTVAIADVERLEKTAEEKKGDIDMARELAAVVARRAKTGK